MLFDNEQLTKYKEYLQLHEYSTNIKQNYGYYANKLLNKDLTQETIDQLCQRKHNVYRSFLKTVIECLKLRDLMVPTKKSRAKKKEIIYFTEKEVKAILDNTNDKRMAIIIRLMYECGLRISEVMQLKVKNFDMVNKKVKGIGKGNKEFNMLLQDHTYALIKHYIDNRVMDLILEDRPEYYEHIFWWPKIKHQRIKALYELKKHIKNILPYKQDNEVFNHALRHSCGTHLRRLGFDLREIQEYLRHSRLETTAVYTAVDTEELQHKAHKAFEQEPLPSNNLDTPQPTFPVENREKEKDLNSSTTLNRTNETKGGINGRNEM